MKNQEKNNFYQVETIVFLALKGFISVLLFENSLFYINEDCSI